MKLIDPNTGALHLPNGIEIVRGMSESDVERQNAALGFPPHRAMGSSHPFGDSTLWWSIREENGIISGASFYLIRNDLEGRYDWEAMTITKHAHDVLLTELLGAQHAVEQLRSGWFESLFRKKGFREFVDSQSCLSWDFEWGNAKSHFDIRDYEPMVFITWR